MKQDSLDHRCIDGTLTIRLQAGSIGERFLIMGDKLRKAGAIEETRNRKTGWWLGEQFLGQTHRQAIAALPQ